MKNIKAYFYLTSLILKLFDGEIKSNNSNNILQKLLNN